jgi:hypothetical protein
MNIKKVEPMIIDPSVAALTPAQVEKNVAKYEALLDENASEARVHAFLAAHTYFFNGALRLFGPCPVYSKVKLGCDYEVDFAWLDSSSFGPDWHLVEIEAPSTKLFTKGGNPTAELTHAVQQLRDWHSWLHDHLEYARSLMPQIEYPLCYIFMGRRHGLTPAMKRKAKRFVYDHRPICRIHTLDWLSAAARSTISLMRGGGGCWPVPMKASLHVDLVRGLPDPVRRLVEGYAAHGRSEGISSLRRQDQFDACTRMSEFDDDSASG